MMGIRREEGLRWYVIRGCSSDCLWGEGTEASGWDSGSGWAAGLSLRGRLGRVRGDTGVWVSARCVRSPETSGVVCGV